MKAAFLRMAFCSFMVFFLLPSNATAANSSVELGVTYYHFDYKEDLASPLKSTEKGWLPGIYGSYEYNKKSNFYGKLFMSYAAGDITYDGSLSNGTPYAFNDSRQRIFKFEGNVGYNRPLGEKASLIPFIGYGYRYWERGQNRIRNGIAEYQENYGWSYIPVGLKLDYAATDKLSLGLSAQANFMFGGKMTAETSKVGITANDLNFDLGNKVGFYAEAPIKYNLTYNWFLSLTPWYEYSQIGQSDTVNGYYEPASRTHWYGVNVGAGYRF